MPPARRFLVLALVACAPLAEAQTRSSSASAPRAAFEDPMVDLSKACPGIVIELRYATSRNVTGKPIYPPGARALLRQSVADRLRRAHAFLQDRGFGLKVWDAYRPPSAQKVLWNAVRNKAYVVEPTGVGSLHGWGAAVDVTLVDLGGREVRMPTDFDSFSEAAKYDYKGNDPEIAFNLQQLKRAMAEAGFRHIRDEWWHYSVPILPGGGGPMDVPLIDPRSGERPARSEPRRVAHSEKPASRRAPRLLFPKRPDAPL